MSKSPKWEKERRALQSAVDRVPPEVARDLAKAIVKPKLHAHCLASIQRGSGIVMACDACWKAVFAATSPIPQRPRKKRRRKR